MRKTSFIKKGACAVLAAALVTGILPVEALTLTAHAEETIRLKLKLLLLRQDVLARRIPTSRNTIFREPV